jgi:hypothetical protein
VFYRSTLRRLPLFIARQLVLKAQVAPLRRNFRTGFPFSEGWGARSVVTPQTFEEALMIANSFASNARNPADWRCLRRAVGIFPRELPA